MVDANKRKRDDSEEQEYVNPNAKKQKLEEIDVFGESYNIDSLFEENKPEEESKGKKEGLIATMTMKMLRIIYQKNPKMSKIFLGKITILLIKYQIQNLLMKIIPLEKVPQELNLKVIIINL